MYYLSFVTLKPLVYTGTLLGCCSSTQAMNVVLCVSLLLGCAWAQTYFGEPPMFANILLFFTQSLKLGLELQHSNMIRSYDFQDN